MSEVTQFSL